MLLQTGIDSTQSMFEIPTVHRYCANFDVCFAQQNFKPELLKLQTACYMIYTYCESYNLIIYFQN